MAKQSLSPKLTAQALSLTIPGKIAMLGYVWSAALCLCHLAPASWQLAPGSWHLAAFC